MGPPARILQPTGAEILHNGTFSAGLADWDGYAFYGASGGLGLDTQVFHSAPAAARLQMSTRGPNGIGYVKLWQDPVPVSHHQSYTLRFWAKADTPRQRLELHLYSEQCPELRCWGDRQFWIPTEWTPIEMSFSATGSAASGLNIFLGSTGSVWIDDISLRAGDTTLYRRDFEHGVVLLNYTNTTRNVALGGTFWRPKMPSHPVWNGARVTSEVVPSSDARFVLRDSVFDPPTSTAPPLAVRRNRLEQNQPNPFNPSTEIAFELAADAGVDLAVYDVAGRRVRHLLAGGVQGGVRHRVRWDGRDEHGVDMPSSVYLCRMRTAAFTATRKMVLVR